MDTPHMTPSDFKEIKFRVAETYWLWKVWKQLCFARDEPVEEEMNQVELLNRFAPAFFYTVQRLLFNEVVVRICKLTDTPQSTRKDPETGVKEVKKTLSLQLAVKEPPDGCDPVRLAHAQTALEGLLGGLKPFKDRRNWLIAHDDLAVVQGHVDPPSISDTQVDAALNGVVEVCELLDPDAPGTSFGYTRLIGMHGDGENVINAMRWAHRYLKEHRQDGTWRLD